MTGRQKRLLLGTAATVALSLAVPNLAKAQVGCSILSQAQLLVSFSDSSPVGSITPQALRNFVCSVAVGTGGGGGSIGAIDTNFFAITAPGLGSKLTLANPMLGGIVQANGVGNVLGVATVSGNLSVYGKSTLLTADVGTLESLSGVSPLIVNNGPGGSILMSLGGSANDLEPKVPLVLAGAALTGSSLAPIFQNASFTGATANPGATFGLFLQQIDNSSNLGGNAVGIYENLILNGTGVIGNRSGGLVNLNLAAATGNSSPMSYNGMGMGCTLGATDAVTGSSCYGAVGTATIGQSVRGAALVGMQASTWSQAGAILQDRLGLQVSDLLGATFGTKASGDDMGIAIANSYVPTGLLGYSVGLSFGRQDAHFPLSSGGTLISAQDINHGVFQIANGVDWHLGIFSGNTWNDGHVVISGSGQVTTTGAVLAQWLAGSLATGLVATGVDLPSALAMGSQENIFASVPAGTGAALSGIVPIGSEITIVNTGTKTLLVYPDSLAGTIDGGGAGVPISIVAGAAYKVLHTGNGIWNTASSAGGAIGSSLTLTGTLNVSGLSTLNNLTAPLANLTGNASSIGGTALGTAFGNIFSRQLRIGQYNVPLTGTGAASQANSVLFAGGSEISGLATADPVAIFSFVPQSATNYVGPTVTRLFNVDARLLTGWSGPHSNVNGLISTTNPPMGVGMTTVATAQGAPGTSLVVTASPAIGQGLAASQALGGVPAIAPGTYVTAIAGAGPYTLTLSQATNQALALNTQVAFIGALAAGAIVTSGSKNITIPSLTLSNGMVLSTGAAGNGPGMTLFGQGIPTDTVIASGITGTGPYTVAMNNAATASGTFAIGIGPSTTFVTASRFLATVNQNLGGVGGVAMQPYNFNGGIFGQLVQANAQVGASAVSSVVGTEVDVTAVDPLPPLSKYGIHIVLGGADLFQGIREDAAFGSVAQGGWVGQGWLYNMMIGGPHGVWPMSTSGWLMAAVPQNEFATVPPNGMLLGGGIDLSLALPSGYSWHSPNAFIGPQGNLGIGAFQATPNVTGDIDLSQRLYTVTGVGISTAGTGYLLNDVVYDSYGDVIKVTGVAGTAVSSVSLLTGGQNNTMGAGTSATYGGNGQGFIPTLIWTTPRQINIQSTGGTTVFGGPASLTSGTATAAGNSQGTSTQLTMQRTIVTGVANGTGVQLQNIIGEEQIVLNRGANALLVYPAGGAQLEAYGANVGVTIAINGSLKVVCSTATQCYGY